MSDEFSDDFDAAGLDTGGLDRSTTCRMWSSRAESAATYAVAGSELRLTIPAQQGLWCPGEHDPLRVSGIQSGVFSGPVGSTIGQQPVREGAVVREFQPTQWGWTPHWRSGRVDFLVDSEHVKTVHQAPDYPMQMMIAVFDFPTRRPRPRPTTCRSSPWTMSAAPDS